MTKIIVFDFDGVLADTKKNMLSYAEQVCAELGYPSKVSAADLNALETMSFDHLGRQLGIPENRIKVFSRRNFELFSNQAVPPDTFPGMREVVIRLATDYPLGIVTGNTQSAVKSFLSFHGLSDKFRVIVDVYSDGNRTDKILRVAKAIGLPENEIYMIGDAVSDIRAIRQINGRSIAVTWGHQERAKLAKEHPDYIVDSPWEILDIFDMEK